MVSARGGRRIDKNVVVDNSWIENLSYTSRKLSLGKIFVLGHLVVGCKLIVLCRGLESHQKGFFKIIRSGRGPF